MDKIVHLLTGNVSWVKIIFKSSLKSSFFLIKKSYILVQKFNIKNIKFLNSPKVRFLSIKKVTRILDKIKSI